MTIDEHIKGLRKRADEYWDRLCSDNLSYIGSIAQSRDNDAYIILSELIKLLEELCWYREQDLIKREDVIELLARHIMRDIDFDEKQARFIAENEYRRIPKAEPPKE